MSELALWHAIPVEDDSSGLVAGGHVELDEQLSDHRGQVLDDLLPGPLDPHRGTVPAGMGVHTAHHLAHGQRERKQDRTVRQTCM